MEIGNKSFESVKHIKYLDITLIIQNFTLEEIESTLNSGSACYHLMQNFFVFQFDIQKYKD